MIDREGWAPPAGAERGPAHLPLHVRTSAFGSEPRLLGQNVSSPPAWLRSGGKKTPQSCSTENC